MSHTDLPYLYIITNATYERRNQFMIGVVSGREAFGNGMLGRLPDAKVKLFRQHACASLAAAQLRVNFFACRHLDSRGEFYRVPFAELKASALHFLDTNDEFPGADAPAAPAPAAESENKYEAKYDAGAGPQTPLHGDDAENKYETEPSIKCEAPTPAPSAPTPTLIETPDRPPAPAPMFAPMWVPPEKLPSVLSFTWPGATPAAPDDKTAPAPMCIVSEKESERLTYSCDVCVFMTNSAGAWRIHLGGSGHRQKVATKAYYSGGWTAPMR